MAEVWLLCEGDSDVPVLSAVLTGVLSADILVRPAGGSSNAASAAEYVSRHHPDVTVAYVVDRDYCRRAVAEATFSDGKRGFMWRRHAIESYLLQPSVVVEALRQIKASVPQTPSGGPSWVRSLPTDEEVVAEGLRRCADARAPEEAARMAVHRLWEDLSDTAGHLQKRSPKVAPGGDRDAIAWRKALQDEAARLVVKATETGASPHLHPDAVGERYDAEYTRIGSPGYLASMSFLEEFRAKDLFVAFGEWLQREHACSLPRKLFLGEIEKALPVVYRAHRSMYGADDFLDLANGVRALAGLSPVS